ncbi:MAG: hypothetical protein ACLRVS_02250 [Lachnospiraceae bacterium]
MKPKERDITELKNSTGYGKIKWNLKEAAARRLNATVNTED